MKLTGSVEHRIRPAEQIHTPADVIAGVGPGLSRGVLVFGSLPPDGRDLDLLVRRAEEPAVTGWLLAHGFVQRGVEFVAFGGCTAVAVDVVPADGWRLRADELGRVFDEAVPLPGAPGFLHPAPHHVLLIAARIQARSRGPLKASRRERIGRAVGADPRAWSTARERAPLWGSEAALSLLQAIVEDRPSTGLRARAASELMARDPALRRPSVLLRRVTRARPGRRVVVALSGIDGAGKSTQAEHLRCALERLGIEAAVLWPPSQNRLFGMHPALKRRLLGLLRRSGRPISHAAPDGPAAIGPPDQTLPEVPGFPDLPGQAAPVTEILAGLVAVSQILAMRSARRRTPGSARVLIYDRHTLDAIVYVRHRWGHGRPLRWQSELIRRLAPRAAVAYLLEIAPERALIRKQDFPLQNLRERAALYHRLHAGLGVTALDAERPTEELCAEIARAAWSAVRKTEG